MKNKKKRKYIKKISNVKVTPEMVDAGLGLMDNRFSIHRAECFRRSAIKAMFISMIEASEPNS